MRLLTGFPGFLGSALAERLLLRDEARLVALVPARHRALADARAGEIEARTGRRVEIVTGDLTADGLGLDDESGAPPAWLGDVTHVFHLAAVYDLAVPDALAERVNVGGTARVLGLCARLPRLERLAYVSTCYVSGRTPGLFGEDDLDVPGQRFANAYERTKHDAERLVRAAMAGGLPATILRPSIVVGDAETGATAKYDGPYGIVRYLLRWPARVPVPLPLFGRPSETAVNLVPRGFVVAALDALAHDAAAAGETVALADPAPLTVDALVAVLARACGRRVLPVPLPASWVGAAQRLPGLERLTGITPASLPYFTHPTRYATTHARRLLAPHGIDVPPFETYADRLVAFVRAHPSLPTTGLA